MNCILIWAAFIVELQIRTHGYVSRNSNKRLSTGSTPSPSQPQDHFFPGSSSPESSFPVTVTIQRQTHQQPKDELQEADEEELDEPEDDNKKSLIPAV